MCPAGWTARGSLLALRESGRGDEDLRWLSLDAAAPGGPRGRPELPLDDARIRLTMPRYRHPLAVPRQWIGGNLVLLVPLLHHGHDRGLRPGWSGPIAAALRVLALACGSDPNDPHGEALGRALCEAVFANTILVLDGTWWGTTVDGRGQASDLVPVGRCVTTPWSRDVNTAAWVDDWIGARLGLTGGPRGPGPIVRSNATGGWPRVSLPPVRQPSLLGRRLHPLRSRNMSTSPVAPGPWARLWDADAAFEPGVP